jgi:DNA-binding NarL/FixJ family response regulator
LVITAEAVDTVSAVAEAQRARPDICLIDLELPGNAISAVAQIVRRVPTTTVVVLASAADPTDLIAVLECGASGYLLKEIRQDELARTLRAAHAGEPALPRSLVPYVIDHIRHARHERSTRGAALTPREREVADLVKAGLSTEEIAARLGLSPVTVRRHTASLARKSGAAGRRDLAAALRAVAR